MTYSTDKTTGTCIRILLKADPELFRADKRPTSHFNANAANNEDYRRSRHKRAIWHNDPCLMEQPSDPGVAGVQPTFLRNRKMQNLSVSLVFCDIVSIFAKVQFRNRNP